MAWERFWIDRQYEVSDRIYGTTKGIYPKLLAEFHIMDRVAVTETVCARYNVSLKTAALQFPLAHRVVTPLVPDARSAAEALTPRLDQTASGIATGET